MKPKTRILLAILWLVILFTFAHSDYKITGFIICVIIGTILQFDDTQIDEIKNFFKLTK